jgi:hypothetical protein
MEMAHTARLLIVAALAFVGANIPAQTLNQPHPVARWFDVVQFGVPRDAKYIFCDGPDCPERSIKHLYVPPPVEAQSFPSSAELSHAKVELPPPAPKASGKKPGKKRVKPKPTVECN